MSLPPPPVPPAPVPPAPAPVPPRQPAGRPRTPDRRAVAIVVLAALLLGLVALVLLLPGGPLAPGDDEDVPVETPPAADEVPPTDETATPEEMDPAELQAARDALFADLVRRDPADQQAVGAVDAPVVMIVWADFRCGHCAEFALVTEPELRARYVDSGVLRIEWRDFPGITAESPAVAAAARAAGLQGQFWAYHDQLFRGLMEGAGADDAALRAAAEAVGLDVARFDADRASPEVQQAVQADMDEALGIGVSSTPTFLVNGNPIGGSQALETFAGVIEAELARATEGG